MPQSSWTWVLLLVFVPCLAAPTCGGGGQDKFEGEPCARADECRIGLDCVGGVCRGPDAGRQDASTDSGTPDDGAVPDAR
jgi:hypothetical protein